MSFLWLRLPRTGSQADYRQSKQTGYIIQVKGFADSSGSAAMNQKLSMERAQNVIAYLIQDCNVPVRHVIAPGRDGRSGARSFQRDQIRTSRKPTS